LFVFLAVGENENLYQDSKPGYHFKSDSTTNFV